MLYNLVCTGCKWKTTRNWYENNTVLIKRHVLLKKRQLSEENNMKQKTTKTVKGHIMKKKMIIYKNEKN